MYFEKKTMMVRVYDIFFGENVVSFEKKKPEV